MAKTCIIIVGPTASGKTALSIRLAQHFRTEIISADSRQCYRELNIGVAKPTAEELAAVRHYFINSHSIQESVTAAIFEELALKWTEEIFSRSDVVIMTGGTGLYIEAFCKGMDPIPTTSQPVRNDIIANFDQHGMQWLQKTIEQEDPLFFAQGEINNPQRSMRALEVMRTTGKSILTFRDRPAKERPFRIIKLGIDLPREMLYQRIERRVDAMMLEGLLREALALFPFRTLNALQTVGYVELFDHMKGEHSLEKAVELVKQHTRNYAKRQLTWFRKDAQVHWLAGDSPTLKEQAIDALNSFL